MTKVNTQAAEFKLITDKKDEPDYKAVSKFVGGMDFVVGPAMVIQKNALNTWAN
jgi:hypothetical protein